MSKLKPNNCIVLNKNAPAWLSFASTKEMRSGFSFTDGPAWHPKGYFLFSDIPANKIYSLTITGSLQLFVGRSGFTGKDKTLLSDQIGSNALAIDANDNIFICQHGNHAIGMIDTTKHMYPFVTNYCGRPFNSPNDIILHSSGSMFFTDPPYGLTKQVLNPQKFQPLAGVYEYKAGMVKLISTQHQYPNGLVFSGDEKFLYISSNHPADVGVLRFKQTDPGHYRFERVFMRQRADGMTTDEGGLLYLAIDEGVLIVSPEGKKLGLIQLPQSPSNLCWGGVEKDTLLVTARSSVYFIKKQTH